jgi:hypothetical protein
VEYRLVETLEEAEPEKNEAEVYHLFVVTAWTGEMRICDKEHTEMGWFTVEEARGLELADGRYVGLMMRLSGS